MINGSLTREGLLCILDVVHFHLTIFECFITLLSLPHQILDAIQKHFSTILERKNFPLRRSQSGNFRKTGRQKRAWSLIATFKRYIYTVFKKKCKFSTPTFLPNKPENFQMSYTIIKAIDVHLLWGINHLCSFSHLGAEDCQSQKWLFFNEILY